MVLDRQAVEPHTDARGRSPQRKLLMQVVVEWGGADLLNQVVVGRAETLLHLDPLLSLVAELSLEVGNTRPQRHDHAGLVTLWLDSRICSRPAVCSRNPSGSRRRGTAHLRGGRRWND